MKVTLEQVDAAAEKVSVEYWGKKKDRSAAVIIAPEHQSSPKTTEAEKTVREVVQDIHDGKFVPDINSEFFDVGMSALLAQHPRIQELVEKLERREIPKTNAEYLEKAHMLYEINEMSRKGFRWDGQERWQGKYNEGSRLVNPMTPTQFIERLFAIGISAEDCPEEVMVRQKNPAYNPFDIHGLEREFIEMPMVKSDKRIYLGARVVEGCVGLFAKVWNEEKKEMEDRRVNKLQVPLSPEWSVLRFDEFDVPVNEKFHGWRTALLSLITNGVITRKQAEQAFGKPKGEAASFYHMQLFQGGY